MVGVRQRSSSALKFTKRRLDPYPFGFKRLELGSNTGDLLIQLTPILHLRPLAVGLPTSRRNALIVLELAVLHPIPK
jgi:hypothetical protein